MNAQQDSDSNERSKSAGSQSPDVQSAANPCRREGRPRLITRNILVLVVLILAATSYLVFFHNPPFRGVAGDHTFSERPPTEPAARARPPVIPLELLFPESERTGPAVKSGASRSSDTNKPAAMSADMQAEISKPIPADASAVMTEVARVAEDVAERYPDDPDSLEVAARTYFWLGDSERAASVWEASLAINPKYPYAHEGLGMIAAKSGDADEAIHRYRKALEGCERAPGMLGTRIRLATTLVDQGRLEEAIDLLAADASSQPVAPEVLVLLGMAHLQSRHYKEARECYEAAIARQPIHANAHFGLATACRRLGDAEAAAKYMKRFQELRAEERAVRTDQRGQYDDVEEMREHLSQMHSNAGRLCHAHGDLAEAEKHWRRAAVLDPKALDCRQAVAWFCQRDGRIPEAIVMLRELAAIEPDNPAYLLEVGRLETVLGNDDEAEATFQNICERLPECADAHASLARLALRRGCELERAAKFASTAASLEPSAENLLLVAAAYERTGELAGAAAAMEQLTMLAPNRPEYQRMHQELLNRLDEENSP